MKTAMQELISIIESPDELVDKDLMKRLLKKEKEQINKSFLEGFKCSGEGYNGEYPFEGCTDESVSISIDLEKYYDSNFGGLRTETANELEKIAEDFAMDFAEWMSGVINSNYRSRGNWFVKGEIKTTKELLEIYKKTLE